MRRFTKQLISLFLLFFTMTLASAQTSPLSVKWEMGKNGAVKNMYSTYFTLTNVSDNELGGEWDLYFNNFARKHQIADENPQFEISQPVPGYFKLSPNASFKALAPGESVKVTVYVMHSLNNISYKPDGFHIVMRDGKETPLAVNAEIVPFTDRKQWENLWGAFEKYPDGNYVYKYNDYVNPAGSSYKGGVYDITPEIKSVTVREGASKMPSEVKLDFDKCFKVAKKYAEEKFVTEGVAVNKKASFTVAAKKRNMEPEVYMIEVENNKAVIYASEINGALNGVKTLLAVFAKHAEELPNAVLIDKPDLGIRAMMLDVSRNFTKYEDLRTYIDLLAIYKINQFQFHFCDDEAWRLEIPGLPELTEVGSRKGYTTDESNCLVQTYAGNGNPDDNNTSANGYITRSQFVELLKFAQSRGVEIVPEIESPAHARAVIVSMKARAMKYFATSVVKAMEYKVWDDEDESVYTSAQGYHDNAMNFAQEGTYRFMEKVVDEVIKMYKDAKVPLKTIHIGGDEVPGGAWEKSPVALNFMKTHGMKSVREGNEYFINRVSEMIESKGLLVGGWQEVGANRSEAFNNKVAHRFGKINAWSTIGRSSVVPYKLANAGYKVVLSNVEGFYMDMAYNRHQDEPGLTWGGTVNIFDTFGVQPYNIYGYITKRRTSAVKLADDRIQLEKPENIVGVQGQLWAETVRDFDMVTYYTFPRIVALAERAWNAKPSWQGIGKLSEEYRDILVEFNHKVASYEMPRIKSFGVNFRIDQPGVTVSSGQVYMNSQYPGVEIRYTLDGSEPNADSRLWNNKPFPCYTKLIKAKAFYLGKESKTTWLWIK